MFSSAPYFLTVSFTPNFAVAPKSHKLHGGTYRNNFDQSINLRTELRVKLRLSSFKFHISEFLNQQIIFWRIDKTFAHCHWASSHMFTHIHYGYDLIKQLIMLSFQFQLV